MTVTNRATGYTATCKVTVNRAGFVESDEFAQRGFTNEECIHCKRICRFRRV